MHGRDYTIDEDTGEKICSCGCGQVLEDKLVDRGHVSGPAASIEKRDVKIHSSMSSNIHTDGSKGSTVLDKSHDFSGHELPVNQKVFANKIQKWQSRTRIGSASERRLVSYFQDVLKLKDELNLPDNIADDLRYYLKKAEKQDLLSGKKTRGNNLALLQLVALQHNKIFKTKELLEHVDITTTRFNFYKNEFIDKLGLNGVIPNFNIEQEIERICTALKLKQKTKTLCFKIVKICRKKGVTHGGNPSVLAATIIYIAVNNTGYYINTQDLADAAGISMPSIANGKKRLLDVVVFMNLTVGVKKSIANYRQQEVQ